MLYSGAGDGIYRTSDPLDPGTESATEQVLESGRVYRIERPAGPDGLLAAASDDAYYSPDGETWTPLGVPTGIEDRAAYGDAASAIDDQLRVTTVGASPGGDRLYAGTFPEHLFVLEGFEPGAAPDPADWREFASFREQPDREAWHTPRHDDAAIVRDVHVHPDAPERLVVGVEVGGVHVSPDGGETWVPRNDGLHEDVHTLSMVGRDELLAATGDGCFHTTDAGRSWRDLAPDGEQRYFREALLHDGDVYAGAAPGPSPTWEGGTDAALFVGRDRGQLEPVDSPRPEEVAIGWTAVDGTPVAATSPGTLLAARDASAAAGSDPAFGVVGSVPVTDEIRGRYLPLVWWPR